MVKHKVRGVFFDLFGTLLVYGDMKVAWAEWLTSFHSCLRPHGLSLSEDLFSRECDRFFGNEEPPEKADDFTVFERRIHYLCVRLGLVLVPTEITRIANHIAGVWQGHIQVDRDAETTLRALENGKALALVSNFDHPPHVHRVLTNHRLSVYFQSIVISGDVGVKKPDPRIFAPALKETGLQPSDVLYVGDTVEDVAAAKAAGIIPVLIQRQTSGTDANALDFTNITSAESQDSIHGRDANVMRVASLNQLVALLG